MSHKSHQPFSSFLLAIFSIAFIAGGVVQERLMMNRIYWKTSTQTDLVGFNIFRAESREGPFLPINDELIPVTGNRMTGNRYEFLDRDVSSAKIYYYWIEVLRFDGTREQMSMIEVTTTPLGRIFLLLGGFCGLLWVIRLAFFSKRPVLPENGGA